MVRLPTSKWGTSLVSASGYDADKHDHGGTTMNETGSGVQDQLDKGKLAGKAALWVFSWPLPNDTIAELRLSGGPITQEHLEMLD